MNESEWGGKQKKPSILSSFCVRWWVHGSASEVKEMPCISINKGDCR